MVGDTTQAERGEASEWTARSARHDEATWLALTRWLRAEDLDASEMTLAREGGARLVEDEARIRAVLGHCPTALAVLDENGLLVGYNRAFRRIVGEGVRVGAAIGGHLDHEGRAMLDTVIRSAGTAQAAGATIRWTIDGAARDVEFLAATIPAATAGSVGVVLAAEDRTAALRDESELAGEQGILAEANRVAAFSLGTASLVHDLGNLVGVAMLSLESLARHASSATAPAAQSDFAARLHDATEALTHCAQILTGVRHSVIPPGMALGVECDVDAVVSDVLRMQRSNLRRAGVRVERRIEPGLRVAMSRGELMQVMLNVIENASHAAEDSADVGRVLITGERTDDADAAVAIRVRDNGIGIEPGRLASVFEPFETSRADRGGTGLGLMIVKRLVEAAGGKVHIVSLPDRGTEVVVQLRPAG